MFFEVQFLIITHCIDRVIDLELAYPTETMIFTKSKNNNETIVDIFLVHKFRG